MDRMLNLVRCLNLVSNKLHLTISFLNWPDNFSHGPLFTAIFIYILFDDQYIFNLNKNRKYGNMWQVQTQINASHKRYCRIGGSLKMIYAILMSSHLTYAPTASIPLIHVLSVTMTCLSSWMIISHLKYISWNIQLGFISLHILLCLHHPF